MLNLHINVLCQVAAAAVIHYLGFTPGLLIVGLYGILIMWIYGYFWITAMLFIGGGMQKVSPILIALTSCKTFQLRDLICLQVICSPLIMHGF